MNAIYTRSQLSILKMVFVIGLMLPISVEAAVLYKSYVVQKDRGIDILCDAYRVQKDDYVWKLFREKGEISEKDFPEFINIFGRLNPHIRDMDRILPGQNIFIPLKKISPNSYPGQETGLVTIPFMTLADTSELLKTHTDAHRVKEGETVSVLIARHFGRYGSRSYEAGIKLFQYLNPGVKNLDLIYAGQELILPDASIQEESWYAALLDEDSGIAHQIGLDGRISSGEDEEQTAYGENMPLGLADAATLLDAKLMAKGRYFVPREGQDDLELDLDRFPMLELKNGSRFIFPDETTMDVDGEELNIIQSNWPDATILPVSRDDSYEKILDTIFQNEEATGLKSGLSFSDQGFQINIRARWIFDEPATDDFPEKHICVTPISNPKEQTPHAIIDYLSKKNIIIRETLPTSKEKSYVQKIVMPEAVIDMLDIISVSDQQEFVAKCLEILGYPYSQRSSITFPYAGIQIKAVSNIILRTNNIPLLVDFGDFHGDAIAALKKTGFDIVQISLTDSIEMILKKLLNALDVPFSENPVFSAAKRSEEYNIFFAIPGVFLPDANPSKILFSQAELPKEVQHLLNAYTVRIVQMQVNEVQDSSI